MDEKEEEQRQREEQKAKRDDYWRAWLGLIIAGSVGLSIVSPLIFFLIGVGVRLFRWGAGFSPLFP